MNSFSSLSVLLLALLMTFVYTTPVQDTTTTSTIISSSTVRHSTADQDQGDGFTDKVNTGDSVFRPIRPGTRVPAANQFPSRASSSDSTPEPSPVTDDDKDAVCFPGNAIVTLHNGLPKRMYDLSIGDSIMISQSSSSMVFMFTHRIQYGLYSFIRLTTKLGHSITLTHKHYLYVNGKLMTADSVTIGDHLYIASLNKSSPVEFIQPNLKLIGLYNPQTLHGDIVINGILASTYTAALHDKVAHALLTPLRALYERLGLSLTCFDNGLGKIATMVPPGSDIVVV